MATKIRTCTPKKERTTNPLAYFQAASSVPIYFTGICRQGVGISNIPDLDVMGDDNESAIHESALNWKRKAVNEPPPPKKKVKKESERSSVATSGRCENQQSGQSSSDDEDIIHRFVQKTNAEMTKKLEKFLYYLTWEPAVKEEEEEDDELAEINAYAKDKYEKFVCATKFLINMASPV